MFDLINQMKGAITPDVTEKLAQFTGESPTATSSALSNIVPALGAGIINKGATADGATELLGMADRTGISPAQLGNLGALFGNRQAASGLVSGGAGILSSLFGNKMGPLGDFVASRSGIGGRSASSLMGLLAPIALAMVGRHARSTGLGAAGLASMFAGQKAGLGNLLPGGLSNVLGLGEPARPYAATVEELPRRGREVREGAGVPVHRARNKWLPAVLLGAAALLLFTLVPRLGRREAPRVERPRVEEGVGGAGMEGARGMVERRLPDGRTINLTQGGPADNLWRSLQAGQAAPIALGAQDFRQDSAALTPVGANQLREVGQVLRAYPSAQVTVAGGAPEGGAPAQNMARARAQAVHDSLTAVGVSDAQVDVAPAPSGPSGVTMQVQPR
ncbi:MAG: DUF937 domain-containing protein [Myxococcaceae bacterium]|nr:DUF937 domain-containing protein [Myxococcaceae bacterium]MCI0671207.1 DUF937 domain-containing protein [Myxococcaceae bacterium]